MERPPFSLTFIEMPLEDVFLSAAFSERSRSSSARSSSSDIGSLQWWRVSNGRSFAVRRGGREVRRTNLRCRASMALSFRRVLPISTAAHHARSRKEHHEVHFVMTSSSFRLATFLALAGCTANRAPVDAPPYGALGFPVTSTSVQL